MARGLRRLQLNDKGDVIAESVIPIGARVRDVRQGPGWRVSMCSPMKATAACCGCDRRSRGLSLADQPGDSRHPHLPHTLAIVTRSGWC